MSWRLRSHPEDFRCEEWYVGIGLWLLDGVHHKLLRTLAPPLAPAQLTVLGLGLWTVSMEVGVQYCQSNASRVSLKIEKTALAGIHEKNRMKILERSCVQKLAVIG